MAEQTEPTWGEAGQDIDQTPSSLCFRKDPYIITGVLIQFTRCHFYSADNIINDKLKGYLWSDDAEETKIQIEPSFKWDSTKVQQRPGIFFKREDVTVEDNFSLGQGKHIPHFNLKGNHTGAKFTVFVRGGHTLLCVGQTAAEAENIGFEVFFKYLEYKDVLKSETNVGSLGVENISAVKKVDENKENWLVSIKIGWIYSYDWTLYQEAPILKKVAFSTSL